MASTQFYKHCLTEDLQEKVAAQLKLLIPEQLALNEEVAVHKSRCADLVKEWSEARANVTALETLPPSVERTKSLNAARAMATVAAERMSEALKLHKDIAVTAAVVESKAREALSERTLMLLMNSVVDLVHEFFNKGTPESITEMKRFEDELRLRVVIQEKDDSALAIEGEFYEMFSSVGGPELICE